MKIYRIYSKGKVWSDKTRTGFRLYTKRQLVYVVAGGTSIHVKVPRLEYNKVEHDGQPFLEVSDSFYENNKFTLDQCMTLEDYYKLQRDDMKTKPLMESFK